MSTIEGMPFDVGLELFTLRAAVNALVSGDAQVLNDGQEIRWSEPICDPAADRLIGAVFSSERQGWVPLIEVGVAE